jgi:hypothetical protein
MNLGELAETVEIIGVYAHLISLSGRPDNSWYAEQAPDGM